jgi:hypothetical protein
VNEETRKALETIAGAQREALQIIRENDFRFVDIGKQPGNWQHLAFTLYTQICDVSLLAEGVLEQLEEAA